MTRLRRLVGGLRHAGASRVGHRLVRRLRGEGRPVVTPYARARRVLAWVEARGTGRIEADGTLLDDLAALARRPPWDERGLALACAGAALHAGGAAVRQAAEQRRISRADVGPSLASASASGPVLGGAPAGVARERR